MKYALAAALSGFQGLGSDDSCERPVDRLGAMGIIARQVEQVDEAMEDAALCGIGVDLIAFKFGQREVSRGMAEESLALALAWATWKLPKLSRRECERIAVWAVKEWAEDECEPCTGSGIHIDDLGVVRTCPACAGSKKRRYSDAERMQALAGDYDRALSVAHGIIGRAEDLAVRHGRAMLERW
jgi:hypothetical protein